MAVLANVRDSLSPRAATGTRQAGQPHVVRPVRRRPVRGVHVDGRRPARLVTAPFRPATQSCDPRPTAGSIGWLVLVGALAFLVVLGIGWSMSGQDAGSVPASTVLVQVHQGETLWGVAQRMAPSGSPAAVVDKIRQLNGLDSDSVLYPGELLQVPSGLSAGAAARAGAIRH